MPSQSKPKTREYLESVLSQARKLMPHWMFAVIHQAALPASGGAAARNRRMSAVEKAWFENAPLGTVSDESLASLLRGTERFYDTCMRKGWNSEPTLSLARRIAMESEKRGMNISATLLGESRKSRPTHLPEGTKISKGFINGEPEGGMHAHGLDRRNNKTMQDGPHIHLFVVPGSGDVLVTFEDGGHAHEITEGGNITEIDGSHSHEVGLFNGDILETKLGGDHSHELMVETSGFGGLHRHTLKLQDGTEIESLSPGEFVARFVDPKDIVSWPLLSSKMISNALNESRRLHEEIKLRELDSQPFGVPVSEVDIEIEINRALAEMAKGGDAPEVPMVKMEVIESNGDTISCGIGDVSNPLGAYTIMNDAKLDVRKGDIIEVDRDWIAKGFSLDTEPHTDEEARRISKFDEAMDAALRHVDFAEHDTAKIVFVSASPSPLEMARKEALIGADGELFAERYLAPMGLKKADVAAGFAIPVACERPTDADIEMWKPRLLKALEAYPGATIVALGRVAKQALGDLAAYSMPHPAAVRRHGDRGELGRKVKAICKALDISGSGMETLDSSNAKPSHGEAGTNLADSTSGRPSTGESRSVAITKSVAEKRIVYGVILDPYQVDAHNDWLPPAEIETTAHDFLSKSRVIGLQHNGVAEAEIVESWIEVYPTDKDRELALQNLPHQAYRRQFGNDTINSGAWIAGAKLSEELWAAHKKGDIDAFSIGGFSFKTKISIEAMPEVEFIDLLPAT